MAGLIFLWQQPTDEPSEPEHGASPLPFIVLPRRTTMQICLWAVGAGTVR